MTAMTGSFEPHELSDEQLAADLDELWWAPLPLLGWRTDGAGSSSCREEE